MTRIFLVAGGVVTSWCGGTVIAILGTLAELQALLKERDLGREHAVLRGSFKKNRAPGFFVADLTECAG